MKRSMIIYMLTALAVSFTACGSDDGDEFMEPVKNNEVAQDTVAAQDSVAAQDTIVENDPNVVKPIPKTDLDYSVLTFLNSVGASEWNFIIRSANRRDTCIIINSEEDLFANYNYHPEYAGPIPAIDFTKYTIIVGQHDWLPYLCFLYSQQIRKEEDGLVLELLINDYSDCDNIAWFEDFGHFGGLYPKLEGDIVRIKKITSKYTGGQFGKKP